MCSRLDVIAAFLKGVRFLMASWEILGKQETLHLLFATRYQLSKRWKVTILVIVWPPRASTATNRMENQTKPLDWEEKVVIYKASTDYRWK